MLKKSYSKTGRACRVTFKFTPGEEAANAALLGEFNSWDPQAHPMTRRKDGSFSTTLSLDAGREYRFRYLVDGDKWDNDFESDNEVLNRFGSRDSVIAV